MNSLFRRDYIYKMNINDTLSLRYLCFDNKTQRYIFLQGSTKSSAEFRIYVPKQNYKVLNSIKVVKWVGYQATNQYSEVKGIKKQSERSNLIKCLNKFNYYLAGEGDSYNREGKKREEAHELLRASVKNYIKIASKDDLIELMNNYGGLVSNYMLY